MVLIMAKKYSLSAFFIISIVLTTIVYGAALSSTLIIEFPDLIEAEIGGSNSYDIMVSSSGSNSPDTKLVISGIPSEWIEINPEIQSIPFGGKRTFTLILNVPVDDNAGDVLAMTIQATSSTGISATKEVSLTLFSAEEPQAEQPQVDEQPHVEEQPSNTGLITGGIAAWWWIILLVVIALIYILYKKDKLGFLGL